MGRRILAERVFTPDMLTTKPTSMSRLLAIPEPDEDNKGTAGLQGFSEQVEFDAERTLTVTRAGGGRDNDDEYDGLFRAAFPSLRDDSGDEIMDNELLGIPLPSVYAMGAERSFSPRVCQGITGSPSTKEIGTPKIVPLERYRKAQGYYPSAILGALFYWQEDSPGSTVFDLYMTLLPAAENHPTTAAAEWYHSSAGPYPFKLIDGGDAGVDLTSGDNWPCVDGVEMDDGTIMLVWSDGEDYIHVGRLQSFQTYTEVSKFVRRTGTGSQTWHVGIERIGSRLVVVYHYGLSAGGYGTYVRYSDDNGLTWSSQIILDEDVGAAASDRPTVDMVKDVDGKVYVVCADAGGDIDCWVTGDGANWLGNADSAPETVGYPLKGGSYRDATLALDAHGQWHLYTIDSATGANQIKRYTTSIRTASTRANQLTTNAFVDEEPVLPGLTDADAEPMGMCARALNQGGFIDLAIVMKDDGSGTAYWTIWVVRLAMWATAQREVDEEFVAGKNYDQVWMANCRPTTAGNHPNVNQYSRTLSSGNEDLEDDDGGQLRLWNSAGGDAYYDKTLADDSYDDGVIALFELQCTANGEAKVYVRYTSNAGASDADTAFHIAFDGANDEIKLYNRTGGVEQTFEPQNWSTRDWNQYKLVAKEDTVQLWRAPVDMHREVCPMEPVVFAINLAKTTYSGQNNTILWGIENGTLAPTGSQSECYWRSFFLANDDENVSATYRGRRMALQPVGLLANEAFRFNGDFIYSGEDWTVETRGIYDGENILSPSPSLLWKEPLQTGSGNSPIREFVIDRGQDSESHGLEVPLHGFALFNRNFLDFKLEVKSAAGTASYVTVFDTSSTGNSDNPFLGPLDVGSLSNNRMIPEKAGGGTEWDDLILPAIENSLSSDDRQRWFIRFLDGSAADETYEIRDVTRRGELVFHKNLAQDFVAVGDEFVIFGSEFFFAAAPDADPWIARYVKLTIYAQRRPDTDDAIQLGTLLLGRSMDLDDDEWSHKMSTRSNLSASRSRAGIEQVRRLGPMRRIVKSRYTGQRDRGMGRTTPHELFRFLGGGLHPLAWIDDDSPITVVTGSGSPKNQTGHHFPLLARMTGPVEQSHRSYLLEEDDGVQGIEEGDVVRNLFDVDGFTFEEVV